jgi:hypothetical protein
VPNVISKPLERHAAVLKLLILRDLGLVCGILKIGPTRQYADVDAKVLARKVM